MKRVIWTVRPRGRFGWTVTRDGKMEFHFLFKFRAVSFARGLCAFEWSGYHYPSELMIADRKGRYTAEGATYGNDPRQVIG